MERIPGIKLFMDFVFSGNDDKSATELTSRKKRSRKIAGLISLLGAKKIGFNHPLAMVFGVIVRRISRSNKLLMSYISNFSNLIPSYPTM